LATNPQKDEEFESETNGNMIRGEERTERLELKNTTDPLRVKEFFQEKCEKE
jgi:hypothetical protein